MIDPELKAHLENIQVRLNTGMQELETRFCTGMQQMEARVNLVIESVTQSLGRDIRDVAVRVGRIENPLDRVETRLTNIEQQLVGTNRSLDRGELDLTGFAATQLPQQKTIEEPVARVTRLEGKERTN